MTDPKFDEGLEALPAYARSHKLSEAAKRNHLQMLAKVATSQGERLQSSSTENRTAVDTETHSGARAAKIGGRTSGKWTRPAMIAATVSSLIVGLGIWFGLVLDRDPAPTPGAAQLNISVPLVKSSGTAKPASCSDQVSAVSTITPVVNASVSLELILGSQSAVCLHVGDEWFEAPRSAVNLQISNSLAGPILWGSFSQSADGVVVHAGSRAVIVGESIGTLRTSLATTAAVVAVPLDQAEVATGSLIDVELIEVGQESILVDLRISG